MVTDLLVAKPTRSMDLAAADVNTVTPAHGSFGGPLITFSTLLAAPVTGSFATDAARPPKASVPIVDSAKPMHWRDTVAQLASGVGVGVGVGAGAGVAAAAGASAKSSK